MTPPPAERAASDTRVMGALALVALFFCAARFGGLASTPYGYWLDETLGAIHVRCLAETGHTDGRPWPLFPRAHGGGVFAPTYVYPALLWTAALGDSIASLRGLAALANVITIGGLAAAGSLLGGRRLAVTAALAGALSPWSFQFSRIAWDPPLGPMFLVWGSVLLLRARTPAHAALAGAVTALAAYSYAPTRLQAALWLPLLAYALRRSGRIETRAAAAALGAAGLAALPLAVLLARGAINARIHELTIFSAPWLEWSRAARGSTPEPVFIARTFVENMAAHLSPGFLFLRGDANLRHSTGAAGVLGGVDLAAAAFFVAGGAGSLAFVRRHRWTAGLLLAGALLGIAPAALCWEGIPHALRSIGAWPFTSMLSGLVLAHAWERRRCVGPVLLAVSVLFGGWYLAHYFGAYRRIDPRWFHPDLMTAVQVGARPARDVIRDFAGRPGYEREEAQFYLMDHDGLGCDEAERAAREVWP